MSADINFREQRLRDGCCPNCGTRLYKVGASGGGVMSKMFKKRNGADGNKGPYSSPDTIKMTPLTMPGVVERGQCIRCADGITSEGVNVGGVGRAVAAGYATGYASLVPTAKAVPVLASLTKSAPPSLSAGQNQTESRKPPPPQSKSRIKANEDILSNRGKFNHGDLKQPPENLSGLFNDQVAGSGNLRSHTESEEDENGSNVSSEDGESIDDYTLLDMNFCRLETDDASSSVVNSLRDLRCGDVDDMDDRKPPAKPLHPNERTQHFSLQTEESLLAFLESTTTTAQNCVQKLECPLGMSPEVFYELPIEMQKEVVESRSNGASQSSVDAGQCSDATSSAGNIDPEVLSSLPEQIRHEILEHATREQRSDNAPHTTRPAATIASLARLSVNTASFLSEWHMNTEDFNSLPEDIKSEIMKEKTRSRAKTFEAKRENMDLGESVYDPESLASLPDEVRKEVLDEERRQREKQRQMIRKPKSSVGAHSVDIPAGYDPETFAALPEDMQQELRDDANRQGEQRRYSADGYNYDSIIGAPVVPAQPMISGMGRAESCTYEGESNTFGKRHGDGVLKWANGDEYVGRFKDGYIEGRGTISFHDGMFVRGAYINIVLVHSKRWHSLMPPQAPNTKVNG